MSVWATRLLSMTPAGAVTRLTGFRPARLEQYAKRKIIPTPSTVNQLRSAYRRVNYARLRSAGLGARAARQLRGRNPYATGQIIQQFNEVVDALAHINQIPREAILHQTRRSYKSYAELTRYPTDWQTIEQLRRERQTALLERD